MKYIVTFYIEEQRFEKRCFSWDEVIDTLREHPLPSGLDINIRTEF